MQISSDPGVSLARALRVERGAVVSFVGGGGKTTSMFRLARELSDAGLRVVATTSTHIAEDQINLFPAYVHPGEMASLGTLLDRYGQCLVAGLPDGKGRVFNIPADIITGLKSRSDVDCILIEADGSKSRPFKAPAAHEPVVPEITTILVPIVGMNCIGRPLDDSTVHRPEIVADLTSSAVGSPITPEIVARVLSHAEGGAKGLPSGGRLVPILNKADTCDIHTAGRIADKLLKYSNVDSVIIGSVDREPPVREAWIPVAGIVLAAGKSSRYGSLKQILPWKDSTLVAHAVRTAIEAGLDPVTVVVGYESERVVRELRDLPVQIVRNPGFEAGQSTSIRAGIDALTGRTGAALFIPVDHPLIDAETINRIRSVYKKTLAPVCVPVFKEQKGSPVLFDGTLFPELKNLHGDTGGRSLFERYSDKLVTVPVGSGAVEDIDTPGDYERLAGRL